MTSSNPFNILGLLAGVPEKDLARRKAQANAYLNVGKPLRFEEDMPWAIDDSLRTKENVAQAIASVEQYSSRALHGFDWFIDMARADGPALAHLRAGDLKKAEDIWRRVASAQVLTEQSLSCASNLGSLVLFRAKNSIEALVEGLSLKIRVIDCDIFPILLERLGDTTLAKEPQAFVHAWSQHLFHNLLSGYCKKPQELEKLGECIRLGSSATAAALGEPVEEFFVRDVERAVAQCRQIRESDRSNAHRHGLKLLASSRMRIEAYKAFATVSSSTYQQVADGFAKELLECAIDHWNANSDSGTVDREADKKLTQAAKEIACGKILKARIEQNISHDDEEDDVIPAKNNAKEISDVLNRMRSELDKFDGKDTNVIKIKYFLDARLKDLAELSRSGVDRELYIKVSSSVVSRVQQALVHQVNAAQERFQSNAISIEELRSLITSALAITKRMSSMEMLPNMRNSYNLNSNTLRELNVAVNTRSFVQTSSSSTWIDRNWKAVITAVVVYLILVKACN